MASATFALLFSPLMITVWSPDGRNIPPPARLGFADSLVCFASLNVLGLELMEGVGVDSCFGCEVDGDVSGRDETGFIRSGGWFSTCVIFATISG